MALDLILIRVTCHSQIKLDLKIYFTNATRLLQRSRHWHYTGTSTTISLPQSLDSSTTRTDELASLPLSLAIQQNSYVGKAWLLKFQDKLPLCVACQYSTAHQCPWRTKGKKVALFENWLKKQVMEYQLIKLYRLNQA
jgi:hypothetical protein